LKPVFIHKFKRKVSE